MDFWTLIIFTGWKNMNDRLTKFATVIIVSSMLFSGCASESDDIVGNDSNGGSENTNNTTGSDPTIEDIVQINGNDFIIIKFAQLAPKRRKVFHSCKINKKALREIKLEF